MTEDTNAVGDAEQWLIAEYEALSENIRQREHFLESTTYYAFTVLGTASSYLLFVTRELRGWQRGWQPLIAFSLALVFVIFFLDIMRQQFEIVWLATVIERHVHSAIAPFYGGNRLLHWEPFRVNKRCDAFGEKFLSILSIRRLPKTVIQLKPACVLVLVLSLAFSAFGCWSWWHGQMSPLQLVLAALLAAAYVCGVTLVFLAGKDLLKQSKQTAKCERAEPAERTSNSPG